MKDKKERGKEEKKREGEREIVIILKWKKESERDTEINREKK